MVEEKDVSVEQTDNGIVISGERYIDSVLETAKDMNTALRLGR
jgi:hypothetical protein